MQLLLADPPDGLATLHRVGQHNTQLMSCPLCVFLIDPDTLFCSKVILCVDPSTRQLKSVEA